MIKKEKKFFLVPILMTVVVIFLSLANLSQLEVDLVFDFSDKLKHILAYMVLTFLYGWAFIKSRFYSMKKLLLIVLLLFVLGTSIEFLQGMMRNGRQFEYLDMLANTVGIGLGMCITIFMNKLNYKHG